MIAMLRGAIAGIGLDHAIIDVQGVGYQVSIPSSLAAGLGEGLEVTLHIATVVREDAFLLYGFESAEARDTFNTLRGVHRIGAANAMSILSTLTLAQLANAVATDDTRTLCSVPGIGKTTASRIALELKDKLAPHFDAYISNGESARPGNLRLVEPDPLPLALAQLDYKKTEIDRAMTSSDVPGPDDAPVEERLRAALGVLARRI